MTGAEKAWARGVIQPTGCITIGRDFGVHTRTSWRGESGPSHVLVYIDAFGAYPVGWHVHHKCHCRACINPAHLAALSPKDHVAEHMKDGTHGAAKAKASSVCRAGHSMEGCIVVTRSDGSIERRCRTCYAANRRRLLDRQMRERRDKPPKAKPTHCKRGHPWTDENITTRPDGYSYCKPCAALLMRGKHRRV